MLNINLLYLSLINNFLIIYYIFNYLKYNKNIYKII